MTSPLACAPLAATVFAVPQFVPQLRKLLATRDTAGLSWLWAALTSINNAAWTAYFALEHDWTALLPAVSVTVLAGLLAAVLSVRQRPGRWPPILLSAWAGVLTAAGLIVDRAGFGTLLAVAFAIQVMPSIWIAFRTPRPTGIAAGTWLLIAAELACWLAFGLDRSDPRLIALGLTGVTASALMLAASRRARRSGRPAQHQQGGVVSRVVVADQAPHH